MADLTARLAAQEAELRRLGAENETLTRQLAEAVDVRASDETEAATTQVALDHARAQVAGLQATVDALQRKRAVDASQLQSDLKRLSEKLVVETEKRGEVEHAKLLVEHELEDLSRCLFEEANRMVHDERRRAGQAEQRCAAALRRVSELEQLLDLEREQCADLKARLEVAVDGRESEYRRRIALQKQLDFIHRSASASPTGEGPDEADAPEDEDGHPASHRAGLRESVISRGTAGSRDSTLFDAHHGSDGDPSAYRFQLPTRVAPAHAPLHLFTHLFLYADTLVFSEFREFIGLRQEKAALASAFLKRCLVEDVEPCLRFSSALVSTAGGNIMAWRFHRRLLAAVQDNTLIIETVPYLASEPIRLSISSPPDASPAPRTWAASMGFLASPVSPVTLPPPAARRPHQAASAPHPLAITMRASRSQSDSPGGPLTVRTGAPTPTPCQLCDLPIEARSLAVDVAGGDVTAASDSLVFFRYRLDDNDPDRRALCHRCRQRLRAACDFYSYARMITRGLLAQADIWRVFAHVQRLRVSMAVSRLGATTLEAACGTETGTIAAVAD
ncbi:hypothetical protein IWQ60_006241 [Tieghemiomyces parasiticus]|uniref:GDP/GTP exchange factor Sec2 N-terminal domain-containing protein n=1 Tax=Tieghemiomyces parasiticus TaxID=78921 RepID=A0A9W8AAB7_9FUNG|nr:hypothetical protein IWQ60_006241 [Tieghemiomyces parasiticus]